MGESSERVTPSSESLEIWFKLSIHSEWFSFMMAPSLTTGWEV